MTIYLAAISFSYWIFIPLQVKGVSLIIVWWIWDPDDISGIFAININNWHEVIAIFVTASRGFLLIKIMMRKSHIDSCLDFSDPLKM